MGKTKTPFFSMGAHGSVGGSITSQKRGRETLLREKPTPAYRRTLPQLYQRWLYEDYALCWADQSQATKDAMRTLGASHHLTAFQYWMKYSLTHLPDILGYWKLDQNTGAVTPDSSRNGNTGTIFGASPATGVISGCLYFDGVNDLVDVGNNPILNIPAAQNFTIEAFFMAPPLAQERIIYGKRGPVGRYYYLRLTALGELRFLWNDGAAGSVITLTGGYDDNQWRHLAVRRLGNNFTFYIDGTPEGTYPGVMGNTTNPFRAQIGIYNFVSYDFKGYIDHVVFYNRPLHEAEIARHAERSYPE